MGQVRTRAEDLPHTEKAKSEGVPLKTEDAGSGLTGSIPGRSSDSLRQAK